LPSDDRFGPENPERIIGDLAALFYEAVLDPVLWPECVRRISESFGHAMTSVTCFRDGRGESLTGTCDPQFLRLYNEHYGTLDPHAAKSRRAAVPGTMLLAEALVPCDELDRTVYYNELMKPMGTYYGIGGFLRVDENGIEVVSLFRSKGQGPFSAAEQQVLQAVAGHFGRARTVYHRIAVLAKREAFLQGSLEFLGGAVAICDGRGRVRFASAAADEELQRRRFLAIGTADALLLQGGESQDRLQAAIRAAAAGVASCLTVSRPWPEAPVVLNFAPVQGRSATPQVLVLWKPGRAGGEEFDPAVLRKMYRLTRAEARVAMLVAQGRETNEIAEALKVQPNTVRMHLKGVYAKTGVRGRAELVRLVARSSTTVR